MTAVVAPPLIGSGAEAIAIASRYADSIADSVIDRDRAGEVPAPRAGRVRRQRAAVDHRAARARRSRAAGFGARRGGPVHRLRGPGDRAGAAVALPVRRRALGLGQRRAARRLFGDVLAGGRLSNGMAERGGQHAQDLATRLCGGGAGLRLQGRKYYCTGAITARWIGVSALDDAGRLVLAFVERDAEGVKIDEDWNVMGQRATVSGTATFDDVAVDPALVVPYQSAFAVPQQLGARAQLCARRHPGRHRGRSAARRRRVRHRPGPPVLRGRPGRLGGQRQRRPAHDPPLRRAGHPGARGRGAARVGRRHAGRGDAAPAGRPRGGPRLGRGGAGQGVRQRGRRARWPATCSR